MLDQITVRQAAILLGKPLHQVRRTADRLWPNLPRVARARVMPREELCRLAAAVERQYGHQEAVSA